MYSTYIWGLRAEGKGTDIARFFGTIVIVLSIISELCIWYYGISYWYQGAYKSPMAMHGMMKDSMPINQNEKLPAPAQQ